MFDRNYTQRRFSAAYIPRRTSLKNILLAGSCFLVRFLVPGLFPWFRIPYAHHAAHGTANRHSYSTL